MTAPIQYDYSGQVVCITGGSRGLGHAMALGFAALPLCVIAAIATGLRIGQYGFTPDRLWALVFVILATVYGVAYFGSLVLGRGLWAARVRPANLRIAFVVAAVALFLATPILSFNAISTALKLKASRRTARFVMYTTAGAASSNSSTVAFSSPARSPRGVTGRAAAAAGKSARDHQGCVTWARSRARVRPQSRTTRRFVPMR